MIPCSCISYIIEIYVTKFDAIKVIPEARHPGEGRDPSGFAKQMPRLRRRQFVVALRRQIPCGAIRRCKAPPRWARPLSRHSVPRRRIKTDTFLKDALYAFEHYRYTDNDNQYQHVFHSPKGTLHPRQYVPKADQHQYHNHAKD